jgi:valyl-tRNA synthetase
MSKSKAAANPALDVLEQYGSDAVRYWAASGRPGTDLTFDSGQLRIGRRLATKLLNASRFVLGLGAASALREGVAAVTEPLDRSLLATLAAAVEGATTALDGYDHTGALAATERFFWTFCDDYIELVKDRAYSGSSSARATLSLALSMQLRMFAPFLPYVTEEAWSWWRYGSVHRAPWPSVRELTGAIGDGELLTVTSEALHQVRRAKTDRHVSMKTPVPLAEVLGPPAELELLALAGADLRAAGGIDRLDLVSGRADSLVVVCGF